MDISPQDSTTTQPMSDDQDLAKALAGVLPDEPISVPEPTNGNSSDSANNNDDLSSTTGPVLSFEETPAPVAVSAANLPDSPSLNETASSLPTPSSVGSNLSEIKNKALEELRPLINRVDLPPEEKFDTYLMLIRSTDDSSLIEQAHTFALAISDEKRKAEALLDVIKEIDYLSRKDQPLS